MSRIGRVEGSHVSDILLDTGCSRTMVKSNQVSEDKFLDQTVTIRCAHGDVALYPLAEVELEVDGARFQVQAAISDRLPVSVLLGTDVPQLDMLLQNHPFMTQTNGIEEAFVMTRAQLKEKQRVEDEESAKEERM